MQKLGLYMGEAGGVSFNPHVEAARVVTVRETRVQVLVESTLGERGLRALAGRLTFGGERVYGRFTEGYMRGSDEPFPVCMQLVSLDPIARRFVLGTPIEPDSTGPDTVGIWSGQYVQTVRRFE
jgi:hypothetical protein